MEKTLFYENNRLNKNLNIMDKKFWSPDGLPELLEFC